ncbi:Protein FAR1-RELATED SEQUENCE 3 [Linum grandiflorum]
MASDGDAESCDSVEIIDTVQKHGNGTEEPAKKQDNGIAEPQVGMEFDTVDAAKSFYEEYAKRVGFSTQVGHSSRSKTSGPLLAREFVCGTGKGAWKRNVATCNAMINVSLNSAKKWVIVKFVKDHTHSIGSGPSKLPCIRPLKNPAPVDAKTVAETYQKKGIVPSGVMYIATDGNRAPQETTRATKNAPAEPHVPKRTLGKDAHSLLEYFKKMQAENPGFFYAMQLDEDNRMTNVFWADARSRIAYSHFGDAISFDSKYKVNLYKVPFVPFTGVNHHGQLILFGCAILLDDSEASYVWLLKTFLTAMNGRHPVSILTDLDKAIQGAVSRVFPETRHCFSKWDVLREGQQKMAPFRLLHPDLQLDLHNCINLTETVEEFELAWSSIIEKYDLSGQAWLQSLYDSRAQWVPVYLRNTFFAMLSPNQELASSFFNGYINHETTLPMFFMEYERALESSFERELEADYETISTTPILSTPSPMEKQAASRYTKKVFTKFQEELVETFVYTANKIEGDETVSKFSVAKFEDDNKEYIVTLHHDNMTANCSCQMFEFSGILCRHVLTVFTVSNVFTLPAQYILQRWTVNAKAGRGIQENSIDDLSNPVSLTARYNNLCREAIGYAEDGATTLETYSAAMAALREGGKKVADVKNNVAKVSPAVTQGNGVSYDDKKESMESLDTPPLLWPNQDELFRKFNQNHTGASAQSVADLNLPRTSPGSNKREDGSATGVHLHLKAMTWEMENKKSVPRTRVAVINLKLQDYSKTPAVDFDVKFQLSKMSLEPMMKSMTSVNEQPSKTASSVTVINLELRETETSTEAPVRIKFKVSTGTLAAMLASISYIRAQLSNNLDSTADSPANKKHRR